MTSFKRVTLWLTITLFCLGAAAQQADTKAVADEKAVTKTAADFPDEPIIYESVRATMRFENDGAGTRTGKVRMRVQTPAGLAFAGQLVFGYNAANEQMEVRGVTVTKPDGTLIKTGPENIQDLSAPVAREAPVYTDSREKHVTVSALAVGDIVEYEVLTTMKPLMAGQFWYSRPFVDNGICLDEQVDLNVPRDRALKLKSPPGVDPVIHEEGERRIYHWATSNLRHPHGRGFFGGFEFDVKMLFSAGRRAPGKQLMFSTFASWEEVGRWYAQLERERRVVTPEIQARANAIVQGKTTDLTKAEALYEWVGRNIRYVSLSFGVGRYQPHAAAEVLSNRYGDCKDKTTLLESFLEAEGLHAQAVLINSAADVDPDLPSPLQFDHAITMLRIDGKDRWLDSTVGVGPFGYLIPPLRDKSALVVFTDAAPILQKTPAQLPMTTLYGLEVNAELNSEHKIEGTLSVELRGDWEVLMRLGFLNMSPGQISSLLQMMTERASKGNGSHVSFSDLKSSDPTDANNPFRISLHVSVKLSDADFERMQKSGPTKSSPEDLIRTLTDSSDANPFTKLLPESVNKLEGATEYWLKLTLATPSLKHQDASQPVKIHIAKDFAEFEVASSWESSTMHFSGRLKLNGSQISNEEKTQYAEFRKQVTESLVEMARSSVVEKKSERPTGVLGGLISPTAPPPRPSASPSPQKHIMAAVPQETTALYGKSLEAMKAKNWGTAEQQLETVVKDAPDWDYAWANLGRTRMALRKYPEAEAAFRKYLELAPSVSIAYQSLAGALNAQEKYAEAVEILQKALSQDLKTAVTLRQLGWDHLHLHQPDLAVHDLETAAALAPKDALIHFLLGSAYLDSHQNEKGAAALEKAVSLNASEVMLNNAAYRLAEVKTHLDEAEAWSLRSIGTVEAELNHTTLQSLQAETATLLTKAAMYWDTLGWIKFQENDLSAAEKYIRAGWELADDTTIGAHLGRIYEAEGHKNQAIETLAQMLAIVPTSRALTDDEKDARKRLGSLLGSENLVEQRVTQAKSRAKERRSVEIANSAGAEGIAQYLVIIGPGSKLTDIQATSPDNKLDGLTSALRAAVLPQSLPDETISSLPATAILACSRSDQPCRFSLLSAGAAARTFPTPQASE